MTNNMDRRLHEHNNRESLYTSTGIPWILLWKTIKPNLEEAELLERKLKHLTRVRKIRFLRKYADGIINMELLDSISP